LYNSSEPFGDLKLKLQNNKIERKDFETEEEKPKKTDPYSCQYCEEVYRIIIFQNIPVKVFKCYYCHNSLNPDSLDYYYKKYDKEINRVGDKLSKSVILKPKEKTIESENGGSQNQRTRKQTSYTVDDDYDEKAKYTSIRTEKQKSDERNDVGITTKAKASEEYDYSPKVEKKKAKEKKEIKIEEEENFVPEKQKVEKVDEPKPAKAKKPKEKAVSIVKEPETMPEENPKNQAVKATKQQQQVPQAKEADKVVSFDKKWVDWNVQSNAEKIENYRKQKELIEININDNEATGLGNSTLADAFKKKKRALVKKFENKAEGRTEPINNNNTTVAENTTVIADKSSNNNTKNADETNYTLKNENTTIGEILNDSDLKLKNNNSSTKEKKSKFEKKKKEKPDVKGSTLPNEPSPELLDRLIYGKKADIGEKEMKEVNKRMYSKLIENKEKAKDAEAEKKRADMQKNKEKLKSYADNLKNNIIKKKDS